MQEFSLPHFGMVLIKFGKDRLSAVNHLGSRRMRWFAALSLSLLGVVATLQESALLEQCRLARGVLTLTIQVHPR